MRTTDQPPVRRDPEPRRGPRAAALATAACGCVGAGLLLLSDPPASSSAAESATTQGREISAEPIELPVFEPGVLSVRELPVDSDRRLLKVFQRHGELALSDGGRVPILVQRGVADIAVEHVRDLLAQMLTPVPGSRFEAEKPAVARAIADSGAALMIFRSAATRPNALLGELAAAGLTGIAINSDEIVLPASPDETQRMRPDAAEAVLLRFVWEYGVARSLPELEALLAERAAAALRSGLYAAPGAEADPAQLAIRFLLEAYQVYYGRRAHIPESTDPWPFAYAPRSREQMEERDPESVEAIEAFFPRYETRRARLWPGLRESYSLSFDPAFAYTHRSRYLDNAALAGPGASGLIGNDRDNILVGSQAANELSGGGGDDAIDGREGVDTAIFRGRLSEYHIEIEEGVVFVIDLTQGRDGTDTLVEVERLRFADADIETRPPPPAGEDDGGPAPARASDASALLEQLRWRRRVVLLVAPSVGDARSTQQLALLLARADALQELDTAIVELAGPGIASTATLLLDGAGAVPVTGPTPADALRARLGVPDDAFAMVLLDRNGTELWRTAEPADADELLARIDASPMRWREKRARTDD